MLRRHHRIFQTSQLVRDVCLLVLAFCSALKIRAHAPILWAHPDAAPVSANDSLGVALLLVLLWPWMGWASGLYVSRRTKRATQDAIDVIKALLLTLLCGVAAIYFTQETRFSRGLLLLFFALSFVWLVAARLAQKALLSHLRRRGRNLRHVLVVGEGSLACQLVRTIEGDPGLGLRVRGFLSQRHKAVPPKDIAAHGGATGIHVPKLGDVSCLGHVLQMHAIDQVFVALPIDAMGDLPLLMTQLSRHTVDVHLVPDLYEVMTLCGSLEDFCGLPMIALQASPMEGLQLWAKRIFDLTFAAVALVMCWPILATIAAILWAQHDGPILFRQRRVGLDGRQFDMLKFRTMRPLKEGQPAQMTAVNDPRRTPFGIFLRRTSLDELPQLFNVLQGSMSLVGPRPEQPSFSKTFVSQIPRYALRHKIKAGMTGWAQVNGMRGNTSIAKRIELDLYYIENWSMALDFKILVRTVLGGFISPHAY